MQPLSLAKSAQMNASLDILKLVETIARQVEADVQGSFFSNGNLSTEGATRRLKLIQGRMETLRSIVSNAN